jgi:hypothetical protein
VGYPFPSPHTQAGCSAHHSVGADGVWVTATIVTIIAFINVIADLKGQSLTGTRCLVGLTDTEASNDMPRLK